MQSESGFKIYDESEMDVSENYEIANEDFGNVTITEREVIISLTESISHIYDGNRIAIDLYDGSLYMEKNGVYTAIVDKEGQIVRKNIDFINKKDDSLPAFVDDHYIIGKLITESVRRQLLYGKRRRAANGKYPQFKLFNNILSSFWRHFDEYTQKSDYHRCQSLGGYRRDSVGNLQWAIVWNRNTHGNGRQSCWGAQHRFGRSRYRRRKRIQTGQRDYAQAF